MTNGGRRGDRRPLVPGGSATATADAGRGPALLKLGALVVLVGAAYAVLRMTPAGDHLTRDGIAAAVAWLRGNPWAPVVFVAAYATATALAVPGTALTLAGGAVFGVFWGSVFNWLAANIGANAAFMVARALGRDGVRRLAGEDSAALRRLDAAVEKRGFLGLLTLRLIPLAPFNVLNFGAGLTALRWPVYAAATAIGIVPGTVVYTFFADAILQGSQEASRDALLRVLLAGALLAALAVLPALLGRLGARLPGARGAAPAAEGAGPGIATAGSIGALVAPGCASGPDREALQDGGAELETPPGDPAPKDSTG